jgi:DNA-dependent RNA polymerase
LLFNKASNELILSSHPKIISYINKINKINISDFYAENRSRNVGILYELLLKTGTMNVLENKINKFISDSPLLQMLDDVLNTKKNINILDKQTTIEKILIEYELKYFKEYFDNNKNQIKFITQEYENILNNYNVFFKEFSINKYSKIKNLFNKNKDKGYGIIVLMILYMGKDKTISIVFKEILIILFNPNSKEDIKRGINKTNLIYRLARKYIKHISLIESIDADKNINNICTFKELKELSKNLSEIDLVHLGDTLFSLINNGSEIFTLTLIKERNSAEILVKINPSYYNSFIVSSVNITQLPMIVKPREIDLEGLYFPYVLTQSNVLNLNENKIIRSKYEQRYKTEGSSLFYDSINYLNSIKFKINVPMLRLVVEEWGKEESILFKGYNKYKEIYNEDSNIIKKDKEKHNALYQLYYNIINIAILYRNQEFYFPVFADFRGRLYTLSNYLAYQGNDLARSLLLFDNNEALTKQGYECLNVYFSNLAGYDKKSWNDKLIISEKITNDFKLYALDKNEDKLKELIQDISEPFQFISLGLAKLDYLEKTNLNLENISINNPILFDASCSGIQHISALTLDKNLATNTNVYSDDINPENKLPEDFYIFALNIIRDKLANSKNELLRNISLNRKIIKTSVMTIPYNISMTGVGEQIEEHFIKN